MKNFFVLIICFSTTLLSAAEVEWTGNTSTSWNNPNNWDCNCLPGPDDDVSIPFGDLVSVNTTVTIHSLNLRGQLTILPNQTLTIDGQLDGTQIALSHFAGSIINEGTFVITNQLDRIAWDQSDQGDVTNNGEIRIENFACTGDCSGLDIFTLNGDFINNGTLFFASPTSNDGISLNGTFTNNGTLQMDNASIDGGLLRIGQYASFINNGGANCLFENITPTAESLVRGLQTLQNFTTVENHGLLRIHSTSTSLESMLLRGTDATFVNTGTLEIVGGKLGINARDLQTFDNQGNIDLRGQANRGLELFYSIELSNSGTITCTDASAATAIYCNGDDLRPQLTNTGTISVSDYLNEATTARGLHLNNADVNNQGLIDLNGSGSGLALDLGTDSLYNATTGNIRLDHFDEGIDAAANLTNAGTLHFGPELGIAFAQPSLNARNSGLISGEANLYNTAIEWLAGSELSPGGPDAIGQITFLDDFNGSEQLNININVGTGQQSDVIRTFNEIDYNGSITIIPIPDFEPAFANYLIFDSGGFTGNYQFLLPDTPNNWVWTIIPDDFQLRLRYEMISSTDAPSDSSGDISVFPNPVARGSELFISIPGTTSSHQAVLYNLNGQWVTTLPLSSGTSVVNMPSHLPAGTYLLYANNHFKKILVK